MKWSASCLVFSNPSVILKDPWASSVDNPIEVSVCEGFIEEEEQAHEVKQEEAKQELPPEEPKLRHLRIAELSGQLAYKRKICEGDDVFTRDYNAFMETVPEEYQEEVKTIYWKGYKHGKRLNPNLTSDGC